MSTILVINSSPRKNSNTSAISSRVAKAAADRGHEIRTIEIAGEKIHPCTGCETCHTRTPGKCVFNDAMAKHYDDLAWAEVIVFSSPVYFFTVNAQMKLFIDRCYAVGVEAFANKRVGAVFAYGDDDPVKSGCVNAIRMFQDICRFVSATWVGAVYGTATEEGEIAGNREIMKMADDFGAALA